MYVTNIFSLRPIPIPAHSIIRQKTAMKILTWLEHDLFYWEEKLKNEETQTKKNKNQGKG